MMMNNQSVAANIAFAKYGLDVKAMNILSPWGNRVKPKSKTIK
jgi:hypothetical protein